ncbi:probable 18S rRNA (guanine-N(7))-methyltransferase [Macrobrachium nipponense]|uniref:probable 18S rRNA (guanine-N(7))-methyltransferase n=1 Tax=Macrobrachium nipponense TaxID=159736 RepID=UPI0030C85173
MGERLYRVSFDYQERAMIIGRGGQKHQKDDRCSRGSRAVFQFYPENDAQVELIVSQAMRAGFTGGLVVDYPNSTKAKKIYLVLMTGGTTQLPKGLQEEGTSQTQALYQRREQLKKIRSGKLSRHDWIMKKKERRKQGKEVRSDSKYTGRKRSGRF